MCALYPTFWVERQQKGKKMNHRFSSHEKVRRLTLAAMLTAIVFVLQLLGSLIRLGPFSTASLVLVPIVIGAALLGWQYGAWLGFVFSAAVLISGDAALFLTVNPFGTFVTVLAKGVLAGTASGLIYACLCKIKPFPRSILAAVACPIVNTVIFLIGCRLFFWTTISQWAENDHASSTAAYAILTLVGLNFLIELLVNLILSPVIVRLVGFGSKEA